MKKFLTLLLLALMPFLAALEGEYNWKDATELHDDILHAFIYPKEPRPMRINAIRIDLKKMELVCSKADKDHGKPMPDFPKMKIETKRQRVRDFLLEHRKKNHNMLLAVNATPWAPWQKPWTHKYGGSMGLVISEGEVVSDLHRDYPCIVADKKGNVEIRIVKKDEKRRKFEMALSGFELILKEGKVIAGDKNLHPRACFGVSDNGKYLYLLTVDGRQEGASEGATTIECAEYLRFFGAEDAVNMDGGGSTTLVVWDKKTKKPLTLSKHKSTYERPVAVSMGIIKK